jgi:hypothetical protein
MALFKYINLLFYSACSWNVGLYLYAEISFYSNVNYICPVTKYFKLFVRITLYSQFHMLTHRCHVIQITFKRTGRDSATAAAQVNNLYPHSPMTSCLLGSDIFNIHLLWYFRYALNESLVLTDQVLLFSKQNNFA